MLHVEDIQVIDSFHVFGPNNTPATMSIHIEWGATGPFVARGKGSAVTPTDPAAFDARFAVARSTAQFEGAEFGFSFTSNPGVSTDHGFAEMGHERNGMFLQ